MKGNIGASAVSPATDVERRTQQDGHPLQSEPLTHLKRLEAESIHIMREVAAEFGNPVMLYSIGKDSSVMLHLAMKAFAPGKPIAELRPRTNSSTLWKPTREATRSDTSL